MRIQNSKIGSGISAILDFFYFLILQEWCLLVEQCYFRGNSVLLFSVNDIRNEQAT